MTKNKAGSKNKAIAPTTSQSIEEQTKQYLEGGGQINVIQSGVSGFNYQKANKHINISSGKAKT